MDIRIDVNHFLIKVWSDVTGSLGAWLGAWPRRRWQAYIARRTESQALPRGLAVTHVRSGDQWRIPGKCPGQEVAGPTLAPMVWVPPPPGEFIMGDDKPGGGAIQKVRLSKGFYLMKYLVSNAQYTQYLNELMKSDRKRASLDSVVRCEMSDIVLESGDYRVLEGRDNYPVVGATWQAAQDYAKYYDLCLPTEAEWEWAARGPERRVYPWGDCWDATHCCCKENQGRPWHWRNKEYVEEEGYWDETEVTYTSPVGSFPNGASWCGALDMAGNLMEWCHDWFGDYPETEDTVEDPPGPRQGERRVVRGGNWFYKEEACRTTDRTHHPLPDYSKDSVGFRCAYTP